MSGLSADGGSTFGTGTGSGGGGVGTIPNPNALTGTTIVQAADTASALAARVHRQAVAQFNALELWYYRDAAWHLFPTQIVSNPGPKITRQYRQPSTLEGMIPDAGGLLYPKNLESAYNYNAAGGYDPLIDEARKVLLRVGCFCHYNLAAGLLPTVSIAATSGAPGTMTDGRLDDFKGGIPLSTGAQFETPDANPFTISLDLGSVQSINHAVARFGTKDTTLYTLPAGVQIQLSVDGATWSAYPVRPVGGTYGDWDDDTDGGRGVEAAFCDLDRPARYVRLVVTPQGANQFLALDEIAVYGGNAGTFVGANRFCGYLGDAVPLASDGKIRFTATGVEKRLADNNGVRLTAQFGQLGPEELADIAYSLLTQPAYWRGAAGSYGGPVAPGEIGWTTGTNLTGLQFPVYQGQNNSELGYLYELFHEVGWLFEGDGNGVYIAREPVYKQRLPDRVFIADIDGNWDARRTDINLSGRDLRNVVRIDAGKVKDGGAGFRESEPNSIARYGERETDITDPIATTPELRLKIASQVLRDYAWRLNVLDVEIQPDFDTRLKVLHGFRDPGRNALYAKACGVAGSRRQASLWALDSFDETISVGEWTGQAHYIPYVPAALDPPVVISLQSTSGATGATLKWQSMATVPRLQGFNVYFSTVGENGPFSQTVLTGAPLTQYLSFPYMVGEQVWAYVTSVDDRGMESAASSILTVLVGTAPDISGTLGGWIVTDLTAAFSQVSGPDAGGYYTYEFFISWTSPPAGFKRMALYFSPYTLPSNINDVNAWFYQDEWHGDYIPSGKMFDRITTGYLEWYGRFRVPAQIPPSNKVYWRMRTSTATTRWQDPQWSNACYGTVV